MRNERGIGLPWSHPGRFVVDVVGACVVLGLLVTMLYPALGRVRERNRASACLSNLRHIGQAIQLYVADFDETYPMNRFPDARHPAGGCVHNAHDGSQPDDNLEGSSINWKRAIQRYVKDASVWACPSNTHLWDAGGYNGSQNFGDETDVFYPNVQQWLPISYALNGSFFHEAVPPCWMGEKTIRARRQGEIHAPAQLLLVLETRESYPDLGDWWIDRRAPGSSAAGPFQSHDGVPNWLFADGHVEAVSLRMTCDANMWTDGAPSHTDGCRRLAKAAEEYR